jgi:Ran GTPase-activating protein (RanGAP) involved in mRNA processing and transport
MDTSAVRILDLQGNDIGDVGVRALADVVRGARALRRLYLGGNHISDDGLRWLADGLAGNASVEKLWLGCACAVSQRASLCVVRAAAV